MKHGEYMNYISMCSTILKKNKQEIILLNDNVFAIKKNILVHKFVTFHYSGN